MLLKWISCLQTNVCFDFQFFQFVFHKIKYFHFDLKQTRKIINPGKNFSHLIRIQHLYSSTIINMVHNIVKIKVSRLQLRLEKWNYAYSPFKTKSKIIKLSHHRPRTVLSIECPVKKLSLNKKCVLLKVDPSLKNVIPCLP